MVDACATRSDNWASCMCCIVDLSYKKIVRVTCAPSIDASGWFARPLAAAGRALTIALRVSAQTTAWARLVWTAA